MTPDEKYADFQDWLKFMPDAIEEWKAELPEDLAKDLDFSLASLDRLEAWLIGEFPDVDMAFGGDHISITDGAARYVGETFRRNFGGRWDMEVHDETDITYGMPHMLGFAEPGPPVVPLMVVYNAVERRTGKYFAFIADDLG